MEKDGEIFLMVPQTVIDHKIHSELSTLTSVYFIYNLNTIEMVKAE